MVHEKQKHQAREISLIYKGMTCHCHFFSLGMYSMGSLSYSQGELNLEY